MLVSIAGKTANTDQAKATDPSLPQTGNTMLKKYKNINYPKVHRIVKSDLMLIPPMLCHTVCRRYIVQQLY